MPRIAKKAGWVLLGIIGSIGIVAIWLTSMTLYVPVKIRSGYGVHTNQWDQGYVSASGTWVIENDRQAFPVQYSELTCILSEKQCQSATAEIMFGNMLSVDRQIYSVERWTDDTVIFTASSALCVDYTYTISRANQRVVGTRTRKKNPGPSCFSGSETLQLSLVDGFKVTQQLEKEASSNTQPFMWATLVAFWVFIGFRVFRRQSRTSVAMQPT